MAKTVADGVWEMLVSAGVRRCYGIVGDALNPMIDALRRNGSVDFVHVRHEEYGAFAAVADACLTGQPVAVCGTAGPGTVHLINGLLDARKERAPVIASLEGRTSITQVATPRTIKPTGWMYHEGRTSHLRVGDSPMVRCSHSRSAARYGPGNGFMGVDRWA